MVLQGWADVVVTSLQNLWLDTLGFLPQLIGAVVVLIVGLIVASGLGALVEKIFVSVRLDSLLSKSGLEEYFHRANLKLRGAYFLGQLVRWFLIVVFLMAAADAIGLYGFSDFLRGEVLAYIPRVAGAVLIILAAVVLGNFLRRIVSGAVSSARLHASNFLGTLTWWAVVLFGFFTALAQLIDITVINTLITGVIAMLALAGGLAFGLGGREYATYLISRLREHTESRR